MYYLFLRVKYTVEKWLDAFWRENVAYCKLKYGVNDSCTKNQFEREPSLRTNYIVSFDINGPEPVYAPIRVLIVTSKLDTIGDVLKQYFRWIRARYIVLTRSKTNVN